MKKLWKTTFREIGGSFGRYLAILLIVVLGVGFFSGLKTTRPTMFAIVNEYVDTQKLFDYRILTTLGLEEEDVAKAKELSFVEAAEGSVAVDILAMLSDAEEANESVFHVQSLTEELNLVRLTAGRMPENGQEIVVDSLRFREADIGRKMLICEDNTENTLEMLRYEVYTIVGIVKSPYYMNFERGTASIGSGTVAGFVYMPMEGLDSEYYTELFIRTNAPSGIYSEPYDQAMDTYRPEVERAAEQMAVRRETSIRTEAQEKIDEAQGKIDDAKKELSDAHKEVEDGKKKLADAREELADGWQKLNDGKEELEKNKRDLQKAERELNDSKKEVEDGWTAYENGKAEYAQGKAKWDSAAQQLEQMKSFMSEAEYLGAKAQLDMQKVPLDEAQQTLAQTYAQLSAADTQIAEGEKKIRDGKKAIADAEAEIAENEQKLLDGEQEILDGEKEVADGEEKIADGEAEVADGEAELADARQELLDMPEALWYALDRSTNVGYACFESDSSIIDQVAQVFPIFFFLVAALVCMTTMNRMVEEQRTQVGIMRALGYGNGAIMMKYMVYSGSAALIGGVIGFFIGSYIFPSVIWVAYSMMYSVGGSAVVFEPLIGALTIAVALACCMGTTYITLHSVMREVPAQLLRPKTPQTGKKILLERLTFLWKHFSFMGKVSARNIFRYKRRLFMMMIGISGCTALIITAQGLNDSIVNVVPEQYGHIQTYDAAVTMKDGQTQDTYETFVASFDDYFADSTCISMSAVDITANGKTKEVTPVMPSNQDQISQFAHLFDVRGNAIAYPGKGEAVISHKLAERLGIHVGDQVSFLDDDLHTVYVKISGICVNYISDFLYATKETYLAQTGTEPVYKTIWATFQEGLDTHEAGAKVTDHEGVVAINITMDLKNRVGSMMSSLNYVILLVEISAGALAFIVLYNLTNINITERIREIATIKVLGFYPGESAMYVFRENLVLTAFGAFAGIFLGIWLHGFVMDCINVEGIAFQNTINFISFVIAIILTFVFAIFVDIFMYGKLQRIDMAESLKSIE